MFDYLNRIRKRLKFDSKQTPYIATEYRIKIAYVALFHMVCIGDTEFYLFFFKTIF